ncbi:hypothetical protein M8J77_023521 [Diaphorina citri]|nr:hypothetical protein M8J77_023521 [Diaphorina citri]
MYNSEQLVIKTLQKNIKDNNVVVTTADKGNSIVLLNRDKYNSKVQDFIKKGNSKVIKDPTPTIDKEVRSYLRNTGIELIQFPHKLINRNPHAPRLYGTVKLHKASDTIPIAEVPIRPVVSSYTSPVYLLEKELVRLFQQHVQWKPENGIKNRGELISAIQNVVCPDDTILLSLDVNSLFSKVIVPVAVQNLSNIVDQHSNLSEKEKQAFTTALQLVTKHNYFKFDGQTYLQQEGCSMGSPLSPLLAEAYMDDFETQFFNSTSPLLQNILTYHRYVDDILILWTGTHQEAQNLLVFANSLRENIKFEIEIGGNVINFLDLTIHITSNKLEFNIYHKPTSTDTCIPHDSTHPQNQKMAAFRAYFNRLLEVPMSEQNTKLELDYIFQIAKNNGYQACTIKKLLHRTMKKFVANQYLFHYKPQKSRQWRSILFMGKPSYKVAKVIQKHENVNIAFYNKNKLKNLIFNMKDPIPSLEKSGIYNIIVPDHGEYIGKTSRPISTRLKEHYASVRNKHPEKSGFASYMVENNVPLSKCSTKVLHSLETNPKKLDLLETLYIRKAASSGKILFNSQLERKVGHELIT